MPLFIDTSALFKRYQLEKGTALVSRLLEEADEPIFMSAITIVEIISNLKRLCEIDKITTGEQFIQQRIFSIRISVLLILLSLMYLPKTLSKLRILF